MKSFLLSGMALLFAASAVAQQSNIETFQPAQTGARGTPLTVTTSDTSGPLPTGQQVDTVIVSNVGSNLMYCNVNNIAATSADQPIPAGSWFAFNTIRGINTLRCIAPSGATTANILGGFGVPSGAVAGSGGGGSNASVSAVGAAVPASATYVAMNVGGNLVAPTGATRGSQQALSVQIVDASGNQITSFGGAGQAFGSAFPSTGNAAGYNDGTNMQAGRVYDVNSGGGTEYAQGMSIRLSGASGSVEGGTSGNPLRVDPTGTTTQPISGSVTATISGTPSVAQSGTWTVQPGNTANTTAWLVTGTGGTFPATQSGTWTVQPGNTQNTTAWLTQDASAVTQGSTTSGQRGQLTQGAVTTSAPSYTTGQTSPLSLDTSGNLRTSVTGTVAATQSGTWSVRAQDGSGNSLTSATRGAERALSVQIVDASGNQVTSFGGSGGTASNYGSAFPSTGTAAGFSDGANMQGARVFDGDSGAGTQYVVGTNLRKIASGGTVEAGTSSDPLRVDPTGTTTQPVSGTITANQGGTWTVQPGNTQNTTAWLTQDAASVTQGSTTSGQRGLLNQGAVTTSAPSYTTAQTSPLSLTTAGGLRTDLSSIAGTATATGNGTVSAGVQRVAIASDNTAFTVNAAQSGTWNINNISGIVSLPTGAATGVTQGSTTSGQVGTLVQGAVTTSAPSYTTAQTSPLSLDTSGNLRTSVSNTVAVSQSGTWSVRAQDGSGNALTSATRGTERALSVQIVDASGNQVTSFGGSGGTASNFGSAFPSTGTAVGFSDGTNMQGARVFDVDSGAGTQYAAGVSLRKSASGGSVEAGTSSDPLRVDPTGTTTQPVSGTVTANQGGTWTVQPGNTQNTTAWLTQDAASVTQGSTTSGQRGLLTQGAVTTAAPSYTTAQTSPLSLTTAGGLRTDLSSIAGTTVLTGNGTAGAGAQRVTIASDNTAFTVNAAQSGTWNINNISGTVSLPTGAATAANQTSTQGTVAAGTAATNSTLVGCVYNATEPSPTTGQGLASQCDSKGRQRGVIMDAAGNSRGANVNASNQLTVITASEVAQGSTTSGQTGTMIMGAVTTSAPTYTTGQTSPFSLDTTGALRVNVVSGSTGNAAASATGSAVPAQADYQGINVGGTLRGQTGVNPTGSVYAAQTDLTSINGVTTLTGNGVTGTGSQRVTIASDNTPFGITKVGVTATTSVTRPADTTAYAAGDAWADSTTTPTSGGFTFSGVCPASGADGEITGVTITDSVAGANTNSPSLQGQLVIFNTSVTAINDNAAFTLSDADANKTVAIIPFDFASGGYSFTNNSVVDIDLPVAKQFACSGSANLRFLIRISSAYVPTSAEVLQFALKTQPLQ